ncbi:MAG TPA: hypothetical protein DDX29_00755 [Clostridiales bacterium]|nr:hypothetical protein [Clostridiales bacterium]
MIKTQERNNDKNNSQCQCLCTRICRSCVGKPICLIIGIKECISRENIPLEIALRALTSNPAKILKLRNKCRIERGFDADLNLLMKK